MGNPETKATIGTRHRTKTNKTKRHKQKTKMSSNMNLTYKLRVNPDAHE
jgi:hypothetical protein